jgi:hypothetical protein
VKPEELLSSLEYVGEDLLAGAEQTVLARKHRPWAKAAAAAVLIAAAGLGGFFLWKNLRGCVSPAATGEDSSVGTEPSEPTVYPRTLNLLTVGGNWTGLSRARYDDLEASMTGSLASEFDLSADNWCLPVYLPEGSVNGYAGGTGSDALVRRLEKAAAWIGAAADDGYRTEFEDVDGSSCLVSCSCETDQGTLTVYADGRIQMLYNEAHAYEARVKLELAAELSSEETKRAIRDACMSECGEVLAERLGLGECGFVTCDRWDPASSAWTVFTIYPLRENPAEQLVSRWFERVQMLTNDGKTLRGFVADRLPGEAKVPEGLWLQGSYPVISVGEAANALNMDCFLCEEEGLGWVSVNYNTLCAQLVYLPEGGHNVLMPFYRFWSPAGEAGESVEYIAVYVPAVRDTYLTDWELYKSVRLPSLTVGEVAKGESALLLTDPEAYLASNPWRETKRINAMSVYQLPSAGAGSGTLYLFDEDKRCAPECGTGFQGSERSEALIRAFADRVIRAAGLNSGLPWGVVEGEYPRAQTVPGTDEPLYAAEIFLLQESSAVALVENYSLARVTLWYRDGVLYGFTLPACTQPYVNFLEPVYPGIPAGVEDPDSYHTEPPETELPIEEIGTYTQVGLYPIITPAEARELAWAGKYVGAAAERPKEGDLAVGVTFYERPEDLSMDLVYLPNEEGRYLMPFYRFLYPIGEDTETGAEVCEARYIPAVTGLYLADYPPEPDKTEPDKTEPDKTEPNETEPNETEPGETEPDPPTPTGGYSPAPVQTAEGQFEIQGLAGNVKALDYGGGCQDPVWADLDGDGAQELVYWCYGPTSGLFTVALCVYGLKEGWPVLKASRIYCLDWSGRVSLSEENGAVFFRYQQEPWEVLDGAAVSQAPNSLRVTLTDAGLSLIGGELPAGVLEWGGPEWGWFGSSFSALQAEIRDRCVLNHWAALVWVDPTDLIEGASNPVYVAVSDNGITVTGLLRYERQQDGTWFCAMQGIEPIEAPEDPEALVGLTPGQLIERLGPCHFDMGSGLYIPCWFTKDCQLLIVHPGYSAELRQLTALGG